MLANSGVRVAELMDIDSEAIDIAVGMSHRGAGYDSGRHLVACGYRRIGYVGHDWLSDSRARLRFDGLCLALAESGVPLVDLELFDGGSSMIAGRRTLETLLARSPDLDAVAFSNDDMAIGGVFHCLATGITLKEKLAIFGFNGLEVGATLPQPLSTVRSNRFDIGRIAVEKILENPQEGGAVVIDTGYEIVVGATA